MRKSAVTLISEAKKSDLNGEDEDKLYAVYEEAYNAYNDLYTLIEDSRDKFVKVKRRFRAKDIVGLVLSIISLAATVIFGVIPFFK